MRITVGLLRYPGTRIRHESNIGKYRRRRCQTICL